MAFDKRRTRVKKRSCRFCGNKEITVDYKNIDLLRNYVSESGKIEPRRATGTCAKHQRLVSNEIKKARQMALIAYVVD